MPVHPALVGHRDRGDLVQLRVLEPGVRRGHRHAPGGQGLQERVGQVVDLGVDTVGQLIGHCVLPFGVAGDPAGSQSR